MKKILVISFIFGLALGIAQLFWTYTYTMQKVEQINVSEGAACLALTPECGVCTYEVKDGKCYMPVYNQNHRGFPFRSAAYGYDSRIDTTPGLYVNIVIWALGVPAMSYLVVRVLRKLKR